MPTRGVILSLVASILLFAPGCSQSGGSPNWTDEEKQAVDAAQAFLARNGTKWGAPTQVTRTRQEFLPRQPGEVLYLVTYSTPADEIKTLGDRAVVVDIATGRVEFVPRC